MAQNKDKTRKSKAQETFEEAENAGRFAGKGADPRTAREQVAENIRKDTVAKSRGRHQRAAHTDAEARRDAAQAHDYKGEAQNVNDDAGRPLNEDEMEHARNKAMEGTKQNRDISDSGTTTRT